MESTDTLYDVDRKGLRNTLKLKFKIKSSPRRRCSRCFVKKKNQLYLNYKVAPFAVVVSQLHFQTREKCFYGDDVSESL